MAGKVRSDLMAGVACAVIFTSVCAANAVQSPHPTFAETCWMEAQAYHKKVRNQIEDEITEAQKDRGMSSLSGELYLDTFEMATSEPSDWYYNLKGQKDGERASIQTLTRYVDLDDVPQTVVDEFTPECIEGGFISFYLLRTYGEAGINKPWHIVRYRSHPQEEHQPE